jgi:hypothetical protein
MLRCRQRPMPPPKEMPVFCYTPVQYEMEKCPCPCFGGHSAIVVVSRMDRVELMVYRFPVGLWC